jgi:hypothetical protein
LYAVAIHPGDLASSVPEPTSYMLVFVGICIALVKAQQKRAKRSAAIIEYI